MSGWFDRLEKAVDALGGAIYAPAGFVVDVATAPWNDDEEYNGLINTLRSRGAQRAAEAWRPADAAFGGADEAAGRGIMAALNWVERDVWQPGTRVLKTPLVAGELADSPTYTGVRGEVPFGTEVGTFFSAKTWQDAFGLAPDISPGQIVGLGQRDSPFALGPRRPEVDILDPEARPRAIREDRLASGSIDILARWYLDPTVIAGKGAAALRSAALVKPITASTNIDKMLSSRPTSRFLAEVYKRGTTAERMDWLMRNKVVEKADDGPALASLLANADDADQGRAILRVAMFRDPNARLKLEHERLDLARSIEHLTQQRIPLLEATLRGEQNAWQVAWGGRKLDDLNAEVASLRGSREHFAALERAAGTLRSQPRVTAGQQLDDKIRWSVWQPSQYNIPVRILRSAGTMRPGVVDLSRPAGITNVQRFLDRTPLMSAEEKGALLDRYASASTEQAKVAALMAAEATAVKKVAEWHGLNPALANEILAQGWRRRDEAVAMSREKVFSGARTPEGRYLDRVDEDGVGVRLPLLESQLVNEHHLLDVDAASRIMGRYASAIRGQEGGLINAVRGVRGSAATQVISGGLEEIARKFHQLWKPAVLLRLGWTIRVLSDEQLRVMSQVGVLGHLPLAAKSTAKSVTRRGTDKFADEITVGPYTLEDAFAGTEGTMFRTLASSRPAWRRLAEDEQTIHNKLRADMLGGDYVTIPPVAPSMVDAQQHAQAYGLGWQRAVNDQIRSSEVGRRVLEGQGDDEIVRFLRSEDARGLRERMPLRSADPHRWVGEVRQHVDHYLPTDELRTLALQGKARFEDLQKAIPEAELRPEIHGASLGWATGDSVIGQTWSRFVERAYRTLGSAPTDVLSRHPFFASLYRRYLNELVTEYDPGAAGTLSRQVLARLEHTARERSLRQVKSTLYELGEQPNLAHTLRFLYPFGAAWREVITRWIGLGLEDPSRLAKLNLVWNSPNRAGLVEKDPQSGEDTITFQVPGWARKAIPGLEHQGEVAVRKDMLNTILASEPWWLPGVGPLVQVPVAEFARKRPDTAEKLAYVLPFGAGEDAKDLVISAWMRRLRTLDAGTEDRVFANTLASIYRTMDTDYRLGKRDTAPTVEEAERAAQRFYALRLAVNLTMPASPSFRSPYQFYWDKAKEYREKYADAKDAQGQPISWEERFLQDFGEDFFGFTESFSKSVNSVAPTVEGYQASKRYDDLLAKLPEHGSLIVGDEDTGTFSGSVYGYQFRERVGPGRLEHQREMKSPTDAIDSIQRREGWITYRKASTLINAELVERGLRTLSQRGAEDLRWAKQQLVEKLRGKYPVWGADYDSFDSGKTARFVEDLESYAGDKRFDDRPGWATLRQYLQIRQAFVGELRKRHAAGGSWNLQAQANADLAWAWDQVGGALTEKDLAFEVIHLRYLERDDLSQGR